MRDRELFEKKAWGHQLINVYSDVAKIHKSEVYKRLQKVLGVKKRKAHFATMNHKEVDRAVLVLRKMIQMESRGVPFMKPQVVRIRRKRPTPEEIKIAIANLKQSKLPWWRKVMHTLFST